jgi:hypothetical protein
MSAPRTVALNGAKLHRGSADRESSPYPCKAGDGRVYANPGSLS